MPSWTPSPTAAASFASRATSRTTTCASEQRARARRALRGARQPAAGRTWQSRAPGYAARAPRAGPARPRGARARGPTRPDRAPGPAARGRPRPRRATRSRPRAPAGRAAIASTTAKPNCSLQVARGALASTNTSAAAMQRRQLLVRDRASDVDTNVQPRPELLDAALQGTAADERDLGLHAVPTPAAARRDDEVLDALLADQPGDAQHAERCPRGGVSAAFGSRSARRRRPSAARRCARSGRRPAPGAAARPR